MQPVYGENALVMAPLAGHSDLPFRMAMRRHGCLYAFAEMIDASSLVFARARTLRALAKGAGEPWLGVQLAVADPGLARKAVEILNDLPFDVLDLNLGCPMPKVTRMGKGAALGADPPRAAAVLEAMAAESNKPVTAKIRILHQEDPAPTVALARRLESAGARAVTVHGRVREAVYSGPCHARIIRAVAESVRVQVLANGGVFDRPSLDALRLQSGCGAVMVARGAMGNPWLFEELAGLGRPAPTAADLCGEIRAHAAGMVELYGEQRGLIHARKVVLDYLSGRGFPSRLKVAASGLGTWSQLESFLAELLAAPRHPPAPASRADRMREPPPESPVGQESLKR